MVRLKPVIRISATLLILLFTLLTGLAKADQPPPPLPPPAFSHASGFYDKPFNLLLTGAVPGATIYYTLDGSDPDPGNLEGTAYQYKNIWVQRPGDQNGNLLTGSYLTHLYSLPISIHDRSSEPDRITGKATSYHNPPWYFPASPVFKGTVVRAIAAMEGYPSSPVVTRTYFIHPHARRRFTLPVIAISTTEDHLFDYHKGIYTPGIDFDRWRQNNPGRHADGGRPANYHRRGVEWEYPAHFAFWDSTSVYPDLNQDIGFRIHGGWSRSDPMKSLRIYARSDYGIPALEYPIFPDQDYSSYKRIILRNSGNDYHYTLFRDALIQETVKHMNFETHACRPSVVFINGEYWGIHNIRERYDKHYFFRVFGIDHDSLDYLTDRYTVKEGDDRHYRETLRYIEDNGLQESEHYEYIQTRIDTENFIDYQIANIYSDNTDWPGNNVDYFRKRTTSFQPDASCGHDGRWRWVAYDMDFGFGLYWAPPDHNTLEFATRAGGTGWPNPDWSTFLLRSFLTNDDFRNEFISRFADLLNTAFLPERINLLINRYKNVLEPSFPEHIVRWKTPSSMHSWNQHINLMRNFAEVRGAHQWNHLMQYFGLADTVSVTVDVSDPGHGHIRINTIDILPSTPGVSESAYPWTGRYFGGVPVRIEAVAREGYRFSHWEGPENSGSPVLWTDPSDAGMVTAHFLPRDIEPGYTVFYSRSEGDLDLPSSWGNLPDGSGISPDSFNMDSAVYYILNRPEAAISGDWSVSGTDSKVVLGDGSDPVILTIPTENHFSGLMDLADNATLILQNTTIPQLSDIAPLSTVVFKQNEKVTIPARTYGHLHLVNDRKQFSGSYTVTGLFRAEDVELIFDGESSLTLEGDLSYPGNVVTSGPENVNILVTGKNDQVFTAGYPNQLDGRNIYLEKSQGSFTLATDLYARNNLRLGFSGSATFSDGGHLLRLDDDLRISGSNNNYDLSGTILLTAEGGTNDLEIYNVALNNLVIDVKGDARPDFNDSRNPVIINNDLTIKSHSSRPVRLGEKIYHIGGDLLLDIAGPGQTEQGQSYLFLKGSRRQTVTNRGYEGRGLLQNLVINNSAGAVITGGNLTFDGLLHFEKGVIQTGTNTMLRLGPGSRVSGADAGNFISGPAGIYLETDAETEMFFPVGKENGFRPVILNAGHENNIPRLYVAEYFNADPPLPASADDRFETIGPDGYYIVEATPEASLRNASITLSYSEKDFPPGRLRIATISDNRWVTLGASFDEDMQGMITSRLEFTRPGTFALALAQLHPAMEDENLIPVYPNPVPYDGTIYLPGNMDIKLFNTGGRKIYSAENVNRIKLRGIPPGIYILKNDSGQYARLVVL